MTIVTETSVHPAGTAERRAPSPRATDPVLVHARLLALRTRRVGALKAALRH